MRQIFTWSLILGLFFIPATDLWGAEIEAGGGSTFCRYNSLHNSKVANLNLITQQATRFPTEWSLGYIFGQSKNSSYLNNDEPTAWIGFSKRFRWKSLILGFGLVAVNQTSQRLSSHLNFKSEAGFQLGPLVALAQHISNAGLYGANDGESIFTINYRFSFED